MLKAQFIGLKSSGQGLPEGQLLYETYTMPVIRAIDPQINLGSMIKAEGKVTNAFGMSQGTAEA